MINNSNQLNALIIDIDHNIQMYANKFNFEKSSLQVQLKNNVHILNERTLSSTINDYLYQYFKSNCFLNVKLAANEFKIKIVNTISSSNMQGLLLEVGGNVNKSYWRYCYVDGFFKIKDLYFSGDNYLFIEYKLDKKFKLIQLATDYLKYKVYTRNNNSNTIFAFVICDEKENYPTIINNKRKLFYMLNKKINTSLPLDTRVYLYVPNGGSNHNDYIDDSSFIKLYEELITISKEADYINQFGENEFGIFNDYQKIFLENIYKYNSKVIKSRYIQQNYSYIVSLWEDANRMLGNDEIYCNLNFSSKDTGNVIKLIDDGSYYFRNFQNNFYANDLILAKSNGLSVSNYTPFGIIVLLDFFNEVILHSNNKPFYHKTSIGRGRNVKSIRYEAIAKEHKKRLMRIYGNSEEELNKIKRLALEIMYFIINVYPLLYDISEKNEIIGESVDKKIYDSLQIIQKSINKIGKIVNYNEKINVMDQNIDNKVRHIVEAILKKY